MISEHQRICIDTDYRDLVRSAYDNLSSLFRQFARDISERDFFKLCKQLEEIPNIESLLHHIAAQKSSEKARDFLTEFILLTYFGKKADIQNIAYEQVTLINGRKYFPDLSLTIGTEQVFVQIKRVGFSADYVNQRRRTKKHRSLKRIQKKRQITIRKGVLLVPWVQVCDEVQLRKSLEKATKKCPCEKGNTLLVVQELSASADMDDITVSEALYGNEAWKFPSGKPFRNADGFYKQPLGKHLSAHIAMRKTDHRMITDYSFVARPNPEFGRDDLLQRLFGDIRILSADDFPSG